ncbi:MAG: insulinase family protein, partial [Bacteroidota bacterium]
NPSEAIFDDFEELLFQSHSIGRNILGTTQSVSKMEQKHITSFIKRNYTADQMVFSFVGNVPFMKFKKEVEKNLSHFQSKKKRTKRVSFNNYSAQNESIDKDLHQAHLILGNVAYHADHPKRHELILLNNYLGGPAMNSLLSLKVREKYGIAYYIESGYTSYSDTGVFSIYLGTDQGKMKRAKQLVLKELRQIRRKKLSPTQLNGAKRQLIGQFALGQDSGLNLCLSFAKSLLLFDRISRAEEIIERIENIKSEDLLDTANEIFDDTMMSSLTFY